MTNEPRLYTYQFSTGTEIIEIKAENLDVAILICKAQYGCVLKMVKMIGGFKP